MATNLKARSRALHVYGGPDELLQCSFQTSGSTADVTVIEQQGCTVARTGVGLFTVTLGRSFKHFTATFSVEAASTAQIFKISSRTANTIVINQVTAGGNTAADTLAARIDVQVVGRRSA